MSLAIKKKNASKKILHFFTREHVEIDNEVDKLEKALFAIRFEGKGTLGKNLRSIHQAITFLNVELIGHMTLEEDIVFPYIEKHVPKLASLIKFLRSEHSSLKKHLRLITQTVKKLAHKRMDSGLNKNLENLKDAGVFFVYLLKSHVYEENVSVYAALNKELHPAEQKELVRQIRRYRSN